MYHQCLSEYILNNSRFHEKIAALNGIFRAVGIDFPDNDIYFLPLKLSVLADVGPPPDR